jgi:dihydrofolate synthase / folylpolyglutamate synthase
MNIKAIKTHKITSDDKDILKVLDQYIENLEDGSIVAVTSKIVSICQGRVIKIGDEDKEELIKKEAQLYLPKASSKYNLSFTVTNNLLVATSGIDESNGNGFYVLWPGNPQGEANRIREFLTKKYSLKKLGVVITDSKTTPLRWGVTGFAISHSGFSALKDYTGKEDLFGRPFAFEKLNMADSLAATSVLVMGEGSEQTPLAVVSEIHNVIFQDRNPTTEELEEIVISLEDDLFAPFLQSVKWQKGGR